MLQGGVIVVIQGLSVEGLPEAFGPLGDVDIETDRVVIWGLTGLDPTGATQQSDLPLEIYMEGNIVFRQGDRTVYADRMFYDVRRQIGTIINAELLTPVPAINGQHYEGLVRLRAAAMRQLDRSRFVAQNGMSPPAESRNPATRLTAESLAFQDNQRPAIDPVTGMPIIDPTTGRPVIDHQMLVESQNNVSTSPACRCSTGRRSPTDLEKPSYYIDNIRVRNDSIFGTQFLLEFDAFQLFGT